MTINRNLIFGSRTVSPFILRFNQKIQLRDVFLPCSICNIKKTFTTSGPNLIKYNSDDEWTDNSFTDRYIKSLKQPKLILNGLYNFVGEFGKLYEEKKENFFLKNRRFRCQDSDNLVDMLFTFDKEEDLNKFFVTADSAQRGGYSSVSLKITPRKTALFSGNISSELVKDGEAKFGGYASMLTQKNFRSFKRLKYFDWSYYSHLVFKVKGDGRTYYVHFSVAPGYKMHQNWVFSYPLFTRGGPYWQVSKIPFSYFYFVSKGRMPDFQPTEVPLSQIIRFGITVRQVEGPFNLEIEYIGLELEKLHRSISPYEHYI